jgi:hypothetical protein
MRPSFLFSGACALASFTLFQVIAERLKGTEKAGHVSPFAQT